MPYSDEYNRWVRDRQRAFMAIGPARLGRFDRATMSRLVVSLLLIAFSLQSYVAQTHIHETAAKPAVLIHHPGHNSPVGSSPFDCPFCQVVTHAGSFLMPEATIPLLAVQWAEMMPPQLFSAENSTAPNRNWQSRAPPSR